MNPRRLLPLLFCFVLAACRPNTPAVSFYYWKTGFHLSPTEQKALSQNNVSRLYLRYFDVGLEGGIARPLGILNTDTMPHGITVIPVIYLKNEVFKKRQDSLPAQVYRLITSIDTQNGISPPEIQFDCDWTDATQASYFRFLKSFKALWGKPLSVTIRLHQVKYRIRTGIPPADRGVLMYYNMGTIGSESNSIYDAKTARRYTAFLKNYPLPLDVALPIFSWGILMRHGKATGLLNKTSEADIAADTNFVRIRAGRYAVKHSIFKGGYYLHSGDEVKLEAISEDALAHMAADLSHNLDAPPQHIIYYDLDDQNLTRYHETTFKEMASRFR